MYTEIFRELVNIMHHDYSGYIDKKGWDKPSPYEDRIRSLESNNDLMVSDFLEIVQDYLLDFKDPHLSFGLIEKHSQEEFDNGFRVRRHKDKLYITAITNENRLNLGEVILSLDQLPISELIEKHQRELMETKAEREDWRRVIPKYNLAEVMDAKGDIRLIELKKYEKAEYKRQHTIRKIDHDTLLMTLSDFWEPAPIDQLLEAHKDLLENTSNLIIDVRTNLGGSTLSYKALEKYLFPKGTNKIDFTFYNMKVNCTNRNADLIIKAIDEELETIENEEYREGLKQWKEQTWERYRGKGFVNFDDENSDSGFEVTGLDFPENIVVLTDNYCGSAGDIFVYLCKQSPKVVVIGRPTMGVNDYSNLSEMVWDDRFKLMYATSRLTQLDHRKAGAEQGIKPDIYIPWTPKHVEADIDLEEAIKLLQEKTTGGYVY
ncbi:S41 family peptidase [Bhargavaea cecembensis]|uniref:S41 family peptidase n=1 Tax=Bhargavaea cecembensis TaxID=394098 RepID=UPI00058E728E|nr:S41 family peptidase [Bhargavaea cecembensis]